jgi:predicted ATP-grasp superfamily ATP-dependent carboligase
VLEINPRYSASAEILERASGRFALRKHVAACAGGTSPDSRQRNQVASLPTRNDVNGVSHGKLILYAKRDVTITPAFFDWAVDQSSIDFEHRQLADIPSVGDEISTGRPVLTLFAVDSARNLDDAFTEYIGNVESRLYSDH